MTTHIKYYKWETVGKHSWYPIMVEINKKKYTIRNLNLQITPYHDGSGIRMSSFWIETTREDAITTLIECS